MRRSPSTTEQILTNAAIVLADDVVHGTLAMRDGLVAGIDDRLSRMPGAIDIDGDLLIQEKKDEALAILSDRRIDAAAVDGFWETLNDDYFLRHRSDEIAWHTEWLTKADTGRDPGLVELRLHSKGDAIEAAFYTPSEQHTFAHATAALEDLGVTIVDARVVALNNGFSLDTFVFMEVDKRIEIDVQRLEKIRRCLESVLTATDDSVKNVTRSAPRQVRMFDTPTSIGFATQASRGRTVLELVAPDRPGLLSKVGKTFLDLGVEIDTAKIMTIGERAEDVFYVCNGAGEPLDAAERDRLRDALLKTIDDNEPAALAAR